MNRIVVSAFVLSLCVLPCFAQKDPVKFGDIPMEDMTMVTYDQDTSADAVILVNYEEANFKQITCHTRIKILKKSGFKLADIKLHSGSTVRIAKLHASTFNLENGKVVESEMTGDALFKNEITTGLNEYAFTFPNVKVGSVLDYTYNYIARTGGFDPPSWEFQASVPVRYSEFWAVIPERFEYRRLLQGYFSNIDYEMNLKQKTGYEARAHHWVARDVPAFKTEPLMLTRNNYISKVDFARASIMTRLGNFNQTVEIMSSWGQLHNLTDQFNALKAALIFSKDDVARITGDITDTLARIGVLHAYIRDNMKWNGRNSRFSDRKRITDAWESKTGSSAEINFILASLLESAGYKVSMVLYSTREHGVVRLELPMLKQFNDIGCGTFVNRKLLVLDATNKYLPYSILPFRSLNGPGLKIAPMVEWVEMVPQQKSMQTTYADLNLLPTGETKTKVTIRSLGYDAAIQRRFYFEKGEETFAASFASAQDWHLDKAEFENMNDCKAAFVEKYEIVKDQDTKGLTDILYMNCVFVSAIGETPFKSETREYPVDFGNASEKLYVSKINLPAGYVIDELPANASFAMPEGGARYSFATSQIGEALTISRSFQLNKASFSAEEYPALREFYNRVVAKEAGQIVLKKKK